MRTLYTILILFISCFSIPGAKAQTTAYDAALAKKLGADEMGMKTYVMVLLKSGKYNPTEKSIKDSLFAGHMSNMDRLAAEGKLAVAGPFQKNNQYRGLFILNANTIEEGKQLVATDPAVKAGIFDFDIFIWYGSAALQEIPDLHRRIDKTSQ